MKKCASFMASLLIRSEPDRAGLRRDLRSRRGCRDAVDDDSVSKCQARADDPQAVTQIAHLDSLGSHHVVRSNRQNDVIGLIGEYRRIRHKESRRRRRQSQANASETARRQQQIAIGYRGTRMDRPARPIEHIIDESECALATEALLIAK